MELISRILQRWGKRTQAGDSVPDRVANRKHLLGKHVRLQLRKAKRNSLVPKDFVKRCQHFFFHQLDDIAEKVVATESHGVPKNHGYQDVHSGIYMVVSVLPWTTEETIQKLSDISSEKPFGYVNMMTNLFFDKWPSPALTHFFHVLLCLGGNTFQMHTAMGDYGGFPKARRKFTAFPVELLNSEERRMIGL